METISFSYNAVRLLVLAIINRKRITSRADVVYIMLHIPSEGYYIEPSRFLSELVNRVLDDIEGEALVPNAEGAHRQTQKRLSLTDIGWRELSTDLNESQATRQVLRYISGLSPDTLESRSSVGSVRAERSHDATL